MLTYFSVDLRSSMREFCVEKLKIETNRFMPVLIRQKLYW